MHLLAATPDGLYRTPLPPFDDGDAEQVLPHATRRLRRGPTGGVYAATGTGLYHASGDADWTDWHDVGLPLDDVQDVLLLGDSLYAAGAPPAVYRCDEPSDDPNDGGWVECGFDSLPEAESWPTVSYRDEAQVRALAGHPDDPNRIVAGIEIGGVVVSDDRGETWRDVSAGLPDESAEATEKSDDVHRLVAVSPDEWLAATGGGVYRTRDAGATWTAVHIGDRPYARSVFVNDSRFYTGVNASPPRWDTPDAAIYVGDVASDDPSLADVGERFAISFASSGPTVLAGCNDGTVLSGPGFDPAGRVPISQETASAYGVVDLLLLL
ncbi:hypothetical protein SAMN04487950_1251 [Halogranum rubrum]|uniref:BNR/Asp-box repeat-containing protein n=1 Tax=Halogranum rubrum TaxID=553466 RepID=A0A1I4CMG8_9EURY|nr:hypothetical protein [Halogranum rubrum]SFK81943.1 hypothetical protein SAMN04487950_1251 [Halogranum rubrum]